jgi:type I restriction enzyme, S subunit
MKNKYPIEPLGKVISPVSRSEVPIPGRIYRQVGVKLWGEGAYEREAMDGSQTRYGQLFRTERDDIIVNKIWARNGSVAVVPDCLSGCYGSGEFPMFVHNRNRVAPRWIHWLTKTKGFWSQCDEKSRGTSGKNRIRPERFLEIEIPLPPLAEQRRIVARIEELAAQIEETRTLRQQAKDDTEAILVSVITSVCGDKMAWATLRNAVIKSKGAVRSGPFGSQLLHEEFVNSGIAAIGTRDVHVNHFELKSGWYVSPEKFEQFRRYKVFPGDILCTIIGGSIGRFCVVPDNVPVAFTTKHIQAMTLDRAVADPEFVSYMLNFHQRCRRTLFSQVEGSAQPSLNAEKVLATELPLPPVPQQLRIVTELDVLQTEISALKKLQAKTAAELDALLPAILDRAFKGEL